MKLILAFAFSLIALAELATSQEIACENLTDITLINKGYNYIEGDIIIPAENVTDFVMSTEPFSPMNAVTIDKDNLWDGGIVPFLLSSSLNQRAQNAIQTAINVYDTKTCLRFVPRTSERNYIYFFPGQGCYSYIGNIRRGRQEISIGNGCEYEGIVIHEIFHAAGRWHEQSRPDRDRYVRINTQNIDRDTISNFQRVSSDIADTQNLDYDFSSIMHYGARAFSINGENTITTVDPTKQNLIGQRQILSDTDLEHVNTLYSCEGQVSTWADWTQWSTCPENCQAYTRNRTRNCMGSGCPGVGIEYQSCGSSECTVASSWGTWNTWAQCSVTCGTGYRYRTRRCENGNDCPGLYYEIDRQCNANPCVVATWSEWSEYGSCSLTCGGGSTTRTRTCSESNACVGPTTQTVACNTNACLGDDQIINNGLRALGCFQFFSTANLFYYQNGSTFSLDIVEVSAVNRAIVKCSQSALSRDRAFFAMIDGYCMQEGFISNTGIDPFVEGIADVCMNRAGSYQSGLAMDLWYIYNPSVITSRVRRDTTFVDGNNTSVDEMEEMEREAEFCGINSGESSSGVGSLAPTMLFVLLSVLALLILQY